MEDAQALSAGPGEGLHQPFPGTLCPPSGVLRREGPRPPPRVVAQAPTTQGPGRNPTPQEGAPEHAQGQPRVLMAKGSAPGVAGWAA